MDFDTLAREVVRESPTYRQAAKMKVDPPTMFIQRRDLQGLNIDGSKCEKCHRHMHAHSWAVLDQLGFVVTCSFEVQL